MLTCIDGEPFSWNADDLAAFGRLVRELNDATTGFAAPAGARPVLVGWDLAAPGTRVGDVVWVAYPWVPLYNEATCARPGIPVPGRTWRSPSGPPRYDW